MITEAKPKIRDYNEHDFKTCCNVFISNISKFFMQQELNEYQDYLQKHAHGSYWVIADGDDILAAGGTHLQTNDTGSLCFGIVRSDLHKQGLGSRLISYRILKLLENPAIKKIRLDTSQHTPEFFQKFGFKTTSVTENFYGAGLHRHDMEFIIPDDTNTLQALKNNFLQV